MLTVSPAPPAGPSVASAHVSGGPPSAHAPSPSPAKASKTGAGAGKVPAPAKPARPHALKKEPNPAQPAPSAKAKKSEALALGERTATISVAPVSAQQQTTPPNAGGAEPPTKSDPTNTFSVPAPSHAPSPQPDASGPSDTSPNPPKTPVSDQPAVTMAAPTSVSKIPPTSTASSLLSPPATASQPDASGPNDPTNSQELSPQTVSPSPVPKSATTNGAPSPASNPAPFPQTDASSQNTASPPPVPTSAAASHTQVSTVATAAKSAIEAVSTAPPAATSTPAGATIPGQKPSASGSSQGGIVSGGNQGQASGGNNQGQAGSNSGNNQGQAGGNGINHGLDANIGNTGNSGQPASGGNTGQQPTGGIPKQPDNQGNNQSQASTKGTVLTQTNTLLTNPAIVMDAIVSQVPSKDATVSPLRKPQKNPAPAPQQGVPGEKVLAEDPNVPDGPDGNDPAADVASEGGQPAVVDKTTRAKDANVTNASSSENRNGGAAQPILSANNNIAAAKNNDIHAPQFAGGNPGMDDPASDAAAISGPNPVTVAVPIVALLLLIIGGIFAYAYVRRRRESTAPLLKFDDVEKKPSGRTVTPIPDVKASGPFSVFGAHNPFAELTMQNSFSTRVAGFKEGNTTFANYFKHFNKASHLERMPEPVIVSHSKYVGPFASQMVPASLPPVNTSSLYSEPDTVDVLETPMTPVAPKSARAAATSQGKRDSMYSVSWTISDGGSSEFGESDKYRPSGASEYDPNMTLETAFDFGAVRERYTESLGLSEDASVSVRDTIIEN